MGIAVVLGFARGWRCGAAAAESRISVERWMLAALALILAVNWAQQQGNPWWFFSLPLVLLAPPFLALALGYALAHAITATVRSGGAIRGPLARLVLICLLIPSLSLLVNNSGIWPSRLSEAHMRAMFQRNRLVFDRIAARYEAALPAECRPGCPDRRAPPAPDGLDLMVLHAWLGVDRGHWQSDGTLHLKWWEVGAFDRTWINFAYVPLDAAGASAYASTGPPFGKIVRKPLEGRWYLIAAWD